MSCHAIIGRGNLGLDLQIEISKNGDTAKLFSRSDGFSWPSGLVTLKTLDPDYVWVAAGAGSVEQVEANFSSAVLTHATMPLELMKALPIKTKIVLFSSDYVANEDAPSDPHQRVVKPLSLYALTKLWLEEGFEHLNRDNACLIRVGSLYGKHFEERTLPGKLNSKYPQPDLVTLPTNVITPTPTSWLAKMMVRHVDNLCKNPSKKIYHCAPKGNVSVLNFGKLILGEGYRFESRDLDPKRPKRSALDCNFDDDCPTWDTLWRSGWWS